MKKFIVHILLLQLICSHVNSQVTGIIPNQGFPGEQNFTTTISSVGIFAQSSSPSGNIYQIYIKQGVYTHYLFDWNNLLQYSANVLHPDTVELTDVDIPIVAPLGLYDLYVIVGDVLDPSSNQLNYILPTAFTVTVPDGYIEGVTYYDINDNGIKDGPDPVLANQKVRLMPGNGIFYSDASGTYSVPVYNGTYTVSYEPDPTNYLVVRSDSLSFTVPVNNNTVTGNDFGLVRGLISITPPQAYQNTTNNVTIFGRDIFDPAGQPQGNITEIYVKLVTTQYDAPYASIDVIDSNTAIATLDIPPGAPFGTYNLYVKTDGINTHILQSAFSVIPYPYNVTGNVFFDANNNGIKDAGDYGLPYQRIFLTPLNNYYFTDSLGDYTIGIPGGATVVTWDPPAGSNLLLSSDSASYTLNISSNVSGLDFGIISTYPDYTSEITYTPGIPRCFQNVVYTVNYSNLGNLFTNGYIKLVKDPLMTFVSANPVPSSISGDSLFWNYNGLMPLIQNTISASFQMPGPFTTLQSKAYIFALDGGNNIQFADSSLLTQNVICSFDPNDKSVVPEGVQALHYTLMGDMLEYLLRFQNTGNDTAFNVSIIDYLDTDFDLSSFRVAGSSHSVQTELKSNGELKFIFNNILLPDSNVNEPESHGFVLFTINAKSGLPNMTPVHNTGYIVFDLNSPVVTNTTLNTLVYVIPTVIIEYVNETGNAIIYPNPFDKSATLLFKNNSNEIHHLILTDVRGRVVIEKQIHSDRYIIEEGLLESGLYLFSLFNHDKTTRFNGKFVVR